jgi:glycosyltransferase involved in cell wall biosynthesis
MQERFRTLGLDAIAVGLSNTGVPEVLTLRKLLRRAHTQAIMVDTPRDLRIAVYATMLSATPIIYRYNLNYRAPRLDLGDRFYLRQVAACVFQSQFIEAQALRDAPPLRRARRYRIANGIDVDMFAPRAEAGARFRETHGLTPDRPVVLTGSKLAANKAHDVALEAVARIRSQGQDVACVLCGDGDRADDLPRVAAALGVPAVFPGLLDPEGMVAALAAADVVLHPAPTEIFPNVVAEAMACARPVVGVDSGGLPEVLGPDGLAGFLVPPADPAALAVAVMRLLHDEALRGRLGAAGRTRVTQEFPLHRMEEGYTRMFGEVAGSVRRSRGAAR